MKRILTGIAAFCLAAAATGTIAWQVLRSDNLPSTGLLPQPSQSAVESPDASGEATTPSPDGSQPPGSDTGAPQSPGQTGNGEPGGDQSPGGQAPGGESPDGSGPGEPNSGEATPGGQPGAGPGSQTPEGQASGGPTSPRPRDSQNPESGGEGPQIAGGSATPDFLKPSRAVDVRIPGIGARGIPIALPYNDEEQSGDVPNSVHAIGWYADGPTPGAAGKAVLAGRYTYKGKPGVFHNLGRMRAGQIISIRRADGTLVIFKVTDVNAYTRGFRRPLGLPDGRAKAELRLITGYPNPQCPDQQIVIIVKARMVDVRS